MPHENIQYTCGLVDETLKVWAPKDVEEIKCVIKGLRKTNSIPKNFLCILKFYPSIDVANNRQNWTERFQKHLLEQVQIVRHAVSSRSTGGIRPVDGASASKCQFGSIQRHLRDNSVQIRK